MKNKLSFIAKVIITQIQAFVALLCLSSCDNSTMKRNISVADSLTEADQAAAVKYIDSITRAEKGISRYDRMKLLLLKTKALNKLNRPLNIDTLTMFVKYFDRHGTANDRMLANYIMGWNHVYNNPLKAMRYFHIAAEAADTTDGNCDYRTLHKVHIHTSLQLMKNNAMTDAMDENALALKYALMAKDTLNAISTLWLRSYIYLRQGKEDKAFDIRSKLYGMYMKHGYTKEAVISLWPLTSMLAERGNLAEAKHCIDVFERESGLIDSTGNIEIGYETYYLNKGIYFAKANKLDSAEYYFRKCINATLNIIDLSNSYIELTDVYKRRHNPDSVAKFAELARITTDTLYAKMNTTHLQQMQAMYDYNKYKLSAEVYKRKAISARLASAIVILTVSVVLVSVAIYMSKKKRARRMEVLRYEKRITETIIAREELCAVNEKLQAEIKQLIEDKNVELEKQKETDEAYRKNIQELEKVRDEIHELGERQKEHFSSLIKEKDSQIERLYAEKQKYEELISTVDHPQKYANEPIIKLLKRHARKDFTAMTAEEMNQLKDLFVGEKQFIKIEDMVSPHEYTVCMLIRTGFTPSDICILTRMSKSNIANIRKRLYTKLTGNNGSSKDFDAYIIDL